MIAISFSYSTNEIVAYLPSGKSSLSAVASGYIILMFAQVNLFCRKKKSKLNRTPSLYGFFYLASITKSLYPVHLGINLLLIQTPQLIEKVIILPWYMVIQQ
jgi:hypothetical protein